jgi:predicted amidohydrolase YtcJ
VPTVPTEHSRPCGGNMFIKPIWKILAVLLFTLLASCSGRTVFYNGPVLTMDGEYTSLENQAVVVQGGLIESVVSLDSLDPALLRRSKSVDLDGNLLMPGLIESHGHLFGAGVANLGLDLRGIRTKEETLAAVESYVARQKKGKWVIGGGWDHTDWVEPELPIAAELDRIAPDNPVALHRIGGHSLWVNSKALEIAGITLETADPDGGQIVRDANGRPTGILLDNAMELFRDYAGNARGSNPLKMITTAQAEAFRNGITTFHDMAFPVSYLPVYKWLYRLGILKLNVRVYLLVDENLEEYVTSTKPQSLRDDRLRIAAVKLVMDGAMGSYGALLSEPYSDRPGHSGLQTTSDQQLLEVARLARDNGYQIAVHAIGDLANSKTISVYERLIGTDADDRYRWRIEHAQFLLPEDIGKIAANHYLPSMQPRHATTDMKWAVRRLGPERTKTAYAWRALIEAGAVIPGGSDVPVEPMNPFWGIYAAQTRQDDQGKPPGGFYPEQRLTRAEALKMYTVWGAFAGFDDKRIGMLKEGYQADLVIVDRDVSRIPAQDLLDTQVLATYLRGKRVYHKTTSP